MFFCRFPGIYESGNDYICANGSISVYNTHKRVVRLMDSDKTRGVFETIVELIDPLKLCYYTDDRKTVLYQQKEDFNNTFGENGGHIRSITWQIYTYHDIDVREKTIRDRFGDEVTFSQLNTVTRKYIRKAIDEITEH